MTKLRKPESIEDACFQAAALLSAPTIAMVLSARGLRVSESLVGKWSDIDAPQTPSLEQALELERLLIKTGHAPIFGELFEQLRPPVDTLEEPLDPVRLAMRTTVDAAKLMDEVGTAMKDGKITPQELISLRSATAKLQKGIARFRRGLVFKPSKPSAPVRRT
jgi:hypothetical protein